MPKQTKQPISVADAEHALAECEQQKARLEARRHELEIESGRHARSEIAGDKTAATRLDDVVREKLPPSVMFAQPAC